MSLGTSDNPAKSANDPFGFGAGGVAVEVNIFAIEAALTAGEAVLSQRFGSAISLTEPEDLAGSGPATVVRARVSSPSFTLPRTLVIKHYPDQPEPGATDPFAKEAVSYQLFTALPPEERLCPELFAHDGGHRVLVIEDLGRLPTLQDILHGSSARAAETALLSWARSLGRMHASTAGREADFNALLRRLGGAPSREDSEPLVACTQVPVLLDDMLGLATPEGIRTDAERAAERARSACYRAFSPVQLWPDNNLVTDGGVRFLDFELGTVRSALVDAGHVRVPFASSKHFLDLPAGMSAAMVAAWRAEVSGIWPAFADNDKLAAYLLDSQTILTWSSTWALLAALRDGTLPASRSAALSAWWGDLAEQAQQLGADAVAAHAGSVCDAVQARFGPAELPLYPAFR